MTLGYGLDNQTKQKDTLLFVSNHPYNDDRCSRTIGTINKKSTNDFSQRYDHRRKSTSYKTSGFRCSTKSLKFFSLHSSYYVKFLYFVISCAFSKSNKLTHASKRQFIERVHFCSIKLNFQIKATGNTTISVSKQKALLNKQVKLATYCLC